MLQPFAIVTVLLTAVLACRASEPKDQPGDKASIIPAITRRMDSLLKVDRDSIKAQYNRMLRSSPHLARVMTLEHTAYSLLRRCETICKPVRIPVDFAVPIDTTICQNSIAARVRSCARFSDDPSAFDSCMEKALSGPAC